MIIVFKDGSKFKTHSIEIDNGVLSDGYRYISINDIEFITEDDENDL